MARSVDRPLIMVVQSDVEDGSESIRRRGMDERTGIHRHRRPFAPVDYEGRSIAVSQCDNVYVFPGVGLAAIVSTTPIVTDSMFASAARTLANLVDDDQLSQGVLYPPLADLRPISRSIAAPVIRQAAADGDAAGRSDDEIEEILDKEIWNLDYPRLQPA